MKLYKLDRSGGMFGHDSYSVAFGDWDSFPVVSMNDKYTLYRSKLIERMMSTLARLEIIDVDDINDFITELDCNDMRVRLVYKISHTKTYMRFKHHAKTNHL